ncbi:LRR receptor-like serine/threonine-protein kinase EFR [Hibiscus syriacus]|uniref:LRR receptor-like serine/threonine-protein kinase EFR n=1 Tax=Hibiscus syriacus TaxID=106335 RepID=UPI0019239AB4|nr:LRR receptor-like serine/threonine-protein kinase EFR [Hibiscus syriacus]
MASNSLMPITFSSASSSGIPIPIPIMTPQQARGHGTDLQALLHFKAKITGDELMIMESWNSSIHFCQWRGVTCGRKHRRVTKLELKHLRISGSLSPYIGNFSFLRELRLVGTNFYNQTPQEISGLIRLERLQLTDNTISGEIPPKLSACSKLTLNDMRGNQLIGEISAWLGLLSNLRVLGFRMYYSVHNEVVETCQPQVGSGGNRSHLTFKVGRLEPIDFIWNRITSQFKNYSYIMPSLVLVDEPTSTLKYTLFLSIKKLFQGLNLLDLATASPEARGNATDLQALVQFKAKITGDQFKIMESWNSSIHFCQWPGVTCGRKHQRVTKLELQFFKISGSLSPYIGNLSFLRELRLVGTNFYNQIPQEIGRLRRLEVLDLTNNSISGKIPSNLSSCSKLTVFDMGGNQLTGEIPTWLGLLSNLRVLGFYRNSLRGSIPHSLGNLSSLEKFGLAFNALSGIIPEALGQLTKLSFLSIAANTISGVVPVTMYSSF